MKGMLPIIIPSAGQWQEKFDDEGQVNDNVLYTSLPSLEEISVTMCG